MDLHSLDAQTLHLVIQMQLEELNIFAKGKKGKEREGETPDVDVAVESYKSDLEAYALATSDRAMCQSLAQAVSLDADLIRACIVE